MAQSILSEVKGSIQTRQKLHMKADGAAGNLLSTPPVCNFATGLTPPVGNSSSRSGHQMAVLKAENVFSSYFIQKMGSAQILSPTYKTSPPDGRSGIQEVASTVACLTAGPTYAQPMHCCGSARYQQGVAFYRCNLWLQRIKYIIEVAGRCATSVLMHLTLIKVTWRFFWRNRKKLVSFSALRSMPTLEFF